MTNTLSSLLRLLGSFVPFLLLILWDAHCNLKKPERSRQFLMPAVAIVFSLVMIVLLSRAGNLCVSLFQSVPRLLSRLSSLLSGGVLSGLGSALGALGSGLDGLLQRANPVFLLLLALNTTAMAAYLVIKRIAISVMRRVFKSGNSLYEGAVSLFYEHDAEEDLWYVRTEMDRARTYLKVLFIATAVVSMLILLIASGLYLHQLLTVPFYPIFPIIIMGEFFFALDGETRAEATAGIEGERDRANRVFNYVSLRTVMRNLFGDKLIAEDTTVAGDLIETASTDAILTEMERSGDTRAEAYALYMRRRQEEGAILDQNYLASGLELLQGKSVLFNNPFYYDLIPYAFFAMDRVLLHHKKVLVVLGRHGTEDDVREWCREGLRHISNVQDMWRVGELSEQAQDVDVGIITRSNVHNEGVHEANRAFFEDVEFVVLIEPSRLITTAQLGLNSLIRRCRTQNKNLTFCSTDKNCDGLVDALSHVLLTSISEVSATTSPQGTCSYMCWEPDEECLQHRMLPSLSRYLGMGTELAFAALKNQVSKTTWYGGETFPVVDIRWIAKQYYYDLLHYAQLPISQETMDSVFTVSPNLWNERSRAVSYLTVEDESCNMFEVKREFATRSKEQSFINVLSPSYLLRDYMAENDSIFNADAKAIPTVVADYARTRRNVVMRMCLKMCSGYLKEEEIRRELMLIDINTDELAETLWNEICACYQGIDAETNGELSRTINNKEYVFTQKTIRKIRRYNVSLGRMEDRYAIEDSHFKQAFLQDLENATYIAEEEDEDSRYLGSELRGHIFQKYLPGQFFTFNGKYYEMLSVPADGEILVRRAADHINGRPAYRQVRDYVLLRVETQTGMGSCRNVGGIRVTRQLADMCVKTPAYWQLDAYHDLAHGRRVEINGIPQRNYCRKPILKIDFPGSDSFTPEVRKTLTLLCNEVFRTLFAENHSYIAAVTPGCTEAPHTYNILGDADENAIYIIEDSQMDIGLLIAAERNLDRIFSIICDYLDWHFEALEKSLNPPPVPEKSDFTLAEPEETEPDPKGFFGKLGRKIRNGLQKTKAFFARLFRKKGKKPASDEPELPVTGGEEVPVPGNEPVEPAKEPAMEAVSVPESDAEAAPAAEPNAEDLEIPEPEAAPPEIEAAPEQALPVPDNASDDEDDAEPPVLMNRSYRAFADVNTSAPAELTFEKEELIKPQRMERAPYHQRYYLLYGGEAVPEGLDLNGTLAFLQGFGYDKSALKQARLGKNIAELIEKSYQPGKSGTHFCDFCGVELTGVEFDILSDGRERCPHCSRTAVRTADDFEKIYRSVVRNMETFYDARITVPVKVQMVNAKRLHRALGKTFVPTGSSDGRVLGVAIRDKKGNYSILVENGSPKLAATMTIAHELTHIWQYTHWDARSIRSKYGSAQELEIYEGMAKWSEIQYTYLIGEAATAKREEMITRIRQDEYGRGLRKYVERYPLSYDTHLEGETPFEDVATPL